MGAYGRKGAISDGSFSTRQRARTRPSRAFKSDETRKYFRQQRRFGPVRMYKNPDCNIFLYSLEAFIFFILKKSFIYI
jgi:hypothetical protein